MANYAHRKAIRTVRLTDAAGMPLKNAAVTAKQVSHSPYCNAEITHKTRKP